MKRQNFNASVKAEIKLRATRDGVTYCEACGVLIKPGHGEVHHLEMDAMKTLDKKTRPLTAKDGAFWCDACHDPVTKEQVAVLSKAKRREAAHLGVATAAARPIQSRGFAKSIKPQKPRTKSAEGQSEIQRRFSGK